MKKRQRMLLLVLCGILECGGYVQAQPEESNGQSWEEAETTPFGRYPETVHFTLGKMINAAYQGFPEGDSYEDNAYTRYVDEKLNVTMEMVFSADSPQYSAVEETAAASGEMPDVMVIDDQKLLERLVENDLVEDLTPYYDTCFSDRIKEMYSSYGEDRFDMVTFGGKKYAVPETDIYSGANFIWLRKDWMDKLGLDDPGTLKDVGEIIEQFIEKDPGNNGQGNTIGLLCDKSLMADTSSCFNVVPVFAAFGAYPGIWLPQEDGSIKYGSVLPEVKEALTFLSDWYKKGILDQEFLVRTIRNNSQLIAEGKSGSFFGWWWAPNNPLQEAVKKNPDAVWQPYLIDDNGDGIITTYLPYAAEKYVVVRKGYEHPEIVMKIISLIYDYARYEDADAQEIQDYFTNNVDPTATPLVINCDYSDAVERVTQKLQNVLEKNADKSTLNTLERGYYNACEKYLSERTPGSEYWAAYTSRITAVGLLMDRDIRYVNEDYSKGYRDLLPEELKEYENEYLLKIIIGECTVSHFDEMIEQWYARGGSKATREANDIYGKRLGETVRKLG